RNAFLAELDRHTIGDMAQPHGALAALLGLSNIIPIVPAAPTEESPTPLT
ncbi:Rrf2 family transcriptional regulator, partial [Burkholderia sp. SIMBA_052]